MQNDHDLCLGREEPQSFTQNHMPYTEAYKQLIFNGSEILNLRLCVAFSPLPSLYFLFPLLAPSQTDSTCVAILRTLAIRNDRGLSTRLHLQGSHQLLEQLLSAFQSFSCLRLRETCSINQSDLLGSDFVSMFNLLPASGPAPLSSC